MNINEFFDESKAQSQVKARIVSNYFLQWASIINRKSKQDRLAYIDLFAGTGRYKDGTASTPLLILDKVIASEELRKKFVSLFVEKDVKNFSVLEHEISSYPGVNTLRYAPKIKNFEVGHEIVAEFKARSLIPSLIFIDPCGYKGLSLELVNSVLKDWACECIFFFNYNRINPALKNPLVTSHMDQIFGSCNADYLRSCLPEMTPDQREKCILSVLKESLNKTYGKFVLPFRFEMEDENRTSHYIVHVSKHQLGYEKMKEIMAKESTYSPQGVPSYEYSPAMIKQPLLLDTGSPLDDLKNDLQRKYTGKRKIMNDIFQEHNVGTPYIKKNYKAALLQLEQDGIIHVERKINRPSTLGDNVFVQFACKE